jgi:CheY-like chemotaxis protein
VSESVSKQGAAASAPEQGQLATDGRKRILLVEGDGFTRLVLLLRLRLAGFGVDFTSNGSLGLGKLRNCHPDILLVELKLCGLSGLNLIKAARSQPNFGDRPIYVFTHASRINRQTRKELDHQAVKVLDKDSITREDLVQIFSNTFLEPEAAALSSPQPGKQPEEQAPVLSEVVVSGAIEELIAGVREQSELFVRETGPRVSTGTELLSRVSSLASCARAAGLADLARHVTALENFVTQLCKHQHACSDTELDTLSRAVEVMSRISLQRKGKKQGLTRFAAVFIDESPYSNRAMEEALLGAGFNPVCFEDPGAARASIESNRTDLILANLALPEAHGLGLANLRLMPLHDRTPIIYAPESLGPTPNRDDVPGRAPRLDRAPLLLWELIVRALNEVQSLGSAVPDRLAAPSPTQRMTGQVNALAATMPGEDSIDLFGRAPQRQAAAPMAQPAQVAPNLSGQVQNAAALKHLFAASGIPSQPIMRAEPAGSGEDQTAELVDGVAEAPVEFSHTEVQALETLTPSVLHPASHPAEPEQSFEDPTAVIPQADNDLNPSAGNGSQTDFVHTPDSSEQALGESSVDTQSMNNRFETPENWSQPATNIQTETDAAGSTQSRDDLAARLCAAEMALYHAQAEVEERGKAIEGLQKQLATTPSAADGPVGGLVQVAQARCAELEQENAALRQAFENLSPGLGDLASQPGQNGKRTQDVDPAVEQAKLQEQQKAEAELREQLEAARAAEKQNLAAQQQAEARCTELEKELKNLRDSASSTPKLPAAPVDKGSEADSANGASAGDLEQGVAALAKATAELARERGERQRSHQLATDLNARLLSLHQDCSRTLQAQGENLSRITTLEQQHAQAVQALERCQADLEQQQAERQLAEAQIQKAREANAQLRKDLSFFEETNTKSDSSRQDLQNRLEARLNAARDNEARLQQEVAERKRLAESLEESQRELQSQARQRESLENELQSTRDLLREREAKLEKEAAERQRLNETQDSLQHDLQDGPERELEFSKLQSALQNEQIERKRQETQLARTRQRALDAALAARALRTSLRRQIRQPVDNLVHSARNLLELEMGDEQKKLAESVLQDVLLVQTRLREPGATPVESSEPAKTS